MAIVNKSVETLNKVFIEHEMGNRLYTVVCNMHEGYESMNEEDKEKLVIAYSNAINIQFKL